MNREKLESYLEKNPFAKLSDVVTQILYDEIVVLDVPPASKLNINQIATDLGISRTPVVEAINRLQAIGFVEQRPRSSGFYVTDMNMRDMIDLYNARTAIECEAAALCAENASTDAVSQLDNLAAEFKKAVPRLDGIRLKETDMPFHKLLVESCGNKYLIRSYNERRISGVDWKIPGLSRAKTADACIQCGTCRTHCPQGIDIPAIMLELAGRGKEAAP